MNSRERFLTALAGGTPDRIPYAELGIDRALAHRLLGWEGSIDERADLESQPFSVDESIALADHLELDNLSFVLRAPVYAERHTGKDGRQFYGEGLIKSREDLSRVSLPDPATPGFFDEAERFAAAKGDRAACFITRAGVFPVLLGMGLDAFSAALYEDRTLLDDLLSRYFDWAITVADRLGGLGFDAFFTTDDMAFKTAPYFSPQVFRELILPHYRRLAEHVSLPWVIHSDGNIIPFLDDLLELGISGLHPLETGAVNIRAVKRRYGRDLCLLGNIDLNVLGAGTEAEVEREVRRVIGVLGPEGGYICTSGNSLAAYCRPENVRAMVRTVLTYGVYPLG